MQWRTSRTMFSTRAMLVWWRAGRLRLPSGLLSVSLLLRAVVDRNGSVRIFLRQLGRVSRDVHTTSYGQRQRGGRTDRWPAS
jgi:hypothetical protein